MKFYIETFGCKVNSYESNFIIESLLEDGFFLSDKMNTADIVIINTCTVTNTADNKCKKYIRRVKRENQNAILVVMGCAVQYNYDTYKDFNIDILLGNRYKSKVPDLLKNYINNHEKYEYHDNNRDISFEDMEINDFDHTRAFIKIQDGCDEFCAFCIIPFVRGKKRCKEFNKIIDEAKKLVDKGHKEIVLTGILTGSYMDNGKDLVDVIDELSKINELKRIRLSSISISDITDKFLNMLSMNNKFCDHLHISLQSGSDEILKKMKRKYTSEEYLNKINDIRNIRPNISITTDIIVGFPEETYDNFLETYEFAKRVKFSKIHVFPYSKRDGTLASRMHEISPKDKTDRTRKLLELSDILEHSYNKNFNNTYQDVLIEEIKNGKSIGHTSNYLRVEIDEELTKNEIYNVKI